VFDASRFLTSLRTRCSGALIGSGRVTMSEKASGDGRLSPHDSLVVLNGIRLSDQSQQEILELVTDIAKRTLLHSGEASISLVRGISRGRLPSPDSWR